MMSLRPLGVAASIRPCLGHRILVRFASSIASTQSPHVHRPYLSKVWLPTGGIAESEKEDAHSKLVRAGYLRQSHAGIFHMLPLGQRVQEKLEKLIDKYMQQVGASKISLSSLSSQALWDKTRRLESYGPELFRFRDRKNAQFLLAPTHEEEITTLVARICKSYKDFPLRLYQIGRKYRDEMRPRHGILRSREFLMKDLYTFDTGNYSALETYEEVRATYSRLFHELGLPYVVAEASSGDIGGKLSHEYHLPSPVGEDIIIRCDSCSYAANEELARAKPKKPSDDSQALLWTGITKDRNTQVNVWYAGTGEPSKDDINPWAVKEVFPQLDTNTNIQDLTEWLGTNVGIDDPESQIGRLKLVNIVDQTLAHEFKSWKSNEHNVLDSMAPITSDRKKRPLNLLSIRDGDGCTKCSSGKLKRQKAIELGHTFHLGHRYSLPLEAMVELGNKEVVPIQMGCHGIGISRIIGAVAEHMGDEKGLNWPRVIAPYEVVIVAGNAQEEDANLVYDELVKRYGEKYGSSRPLDMIIDDRWRLAMGWKLKDADLVGYPVIIVVGKTWADEKKCEVQCRRAGIKQNMALKELPMYIKELLEAL